MHVNLGRAGERLMSWLRGSIPGQSGAVRLGMLVSISAVTSLVLLSTSGTALAHLGASARHSPMSPPPTGLVEKVDAAISSVEDLSVGDFANRNRGRTLVNQLESVLNKIEAGNNQGAVSQLEHAILPKVDGCASGDSPDANDWIDDCDAQEEVYSAITDLIDALNP